METHLFILFWAAMGINACSAVAFLGKRFAAWLLFVPWAGLVVGIAYLTAASAYFNRPDILIGVPIRVDLLMLPPLLLLSLIVGTLTLFKRGKRASEK